MKLLKDLSRDELESMVKSQNSTIERLCSQVSSNMIQKKNNTDKLETELKLIKDITKDFNCKITVIKIVMEYFKTVQETSGIGINPYVHGSFVRQLVEFPLCLDNVKKSNPLGRDIDIILNIRNNKSAKYVVETFIKDFSKTNPEHLKIVDNKECTIPEIVSVAGRKISQYTPGIVSLQNIPHYKFKVDYMGYVVELDIMAYTPNYTKLWNPVDFDVNTLRLDENGMNVSEKGTVFLLDNIKNRVAYSKINIQLLHETAFKNIEQYKSMFNQIIFYLTERLKILGAGYKIKSETLLPELKVERNDTGECPFVRLKDKSWISLVELSKKVSDDKRKLVHKLIFSDVILYAQKKVNNIKTIDDFFTFKKDDNKIITKINNEDIFTLKEKINIKRTKQTNITSFFTKK